MKVICKSNKGSELTEGLCGQFSQAIAYELQVGHTYPVYAQGLFRHCLTYLIDPGDQSGSRHPNWYPADWFGVIEDLIPSSWVYSYNSKPEKHELLAIWGYPELATQENHVVGLTEREAQDVRTFSRRAHEIEKEQIVDKEDNPSEEH